MEYTWHMEDAGQESNSRTTRSQSRGQGPGFIEELDIEAYMSSVGEGCYAPQTIDPRRTGGHQLPESPPDSGSENPYSPSETNVSHAISVPQTVLSSDYMLVHDHIPTHEILQQNGDYIYDELKSDHEVLRSNLNDVVVLPQDSNIVELGIRTVRHDLGLGDVYQNSQMRVDMPDLDQGMINPQLVALGHETLTPVYTSLQEPSTKKRKHSQDTNSQVKCEPAALSPESVTHVPRPAPPSVDGSEAGDDAPLQCIRFGPFQQNVWHSLYDCNLKPLQPPSYVVGADKGFNYSQIDEAFVCQKKNHFQVTCQIQMQGDPHYVKTGEGFKKISNFCLHFYGVKAEDPSQEVRIEQSQSDRTKKPFHPVPVEIRREGAKVTVGRLHFAETTNNNMRKKGRPNPDQRHFQLVVALRAHVGHTDFIIAASASDRIIVRASNPGQFESDCTESWWQRGVSDNSVHFTGRVGINTDRPDESCVVNGNLKVMGHILHPSDARAKHNIEELDTAQQLKNVQSIRVVKFNYDASFAEHSGLLGYDPSRPAPQLDTGVIAQELRRVIPEAVKEAGDVTLPNGDTIPKFLVVNKDRIFMENLGAVKELCKVTGNLESRIDQLERINKKLCKISILQRRDSSRSSVSNDSRYSAMSNSSKSFYSDGNISIDQIRDIARNIRKHECCHKLSHNSPKYTRKQCKNCHGNYSKYGKYYNYNKTCVRYHSNKLEKPENVENPTYTESNIQKYPEESYESTLTKKKDTCLWLKSDDNFSYGNTKLGFCCRKDYGDTSSELISNKFLQIVITILIFIMAVCLVVMSALYFREHQELISMKESRLHHNLDYPHYGKLNNELYTHRTPPDKNQIQNTKSSQHTASKKTPKEKGPHKTTQEYITTAPTESPHTVSTSSHPTKNYASNFKNSVPTLQAPLQAEMPISRVRKVDVVGGGCSFAANTNNELDPECQFLLSQSPCGLDPQTYDNQEPIERLKPDKEQNDTSKPLEVSTRDEQEAMPATLDKNNTLKSEPEPLRNENDSFKSHDEDNYLDVNKQNSTDNGSRMKREVRDKRETRDKLSSEEMSLDQSHEIGRSECDTVRVGISSKSIINSSLFSESVCANNVYSFNYTIPLSHCLSHKHVDLTFRSQKIKEFRLCELQCNYDSSKSCQTTTEPPKPALADDSWSIKMALECNVDRLMRVRASFQPLDLCYHTQEHKQPFIEYKIRIYRDCHN
ncbi:uncharacterized protein LOC124643720 isoform X2 [Helicoverpa zea]|uniref:uncharacterized protein LOC124643720 isoform X2 n=1 Tax=Helicoverpa zea TaxID=7113 RepID=UPI001F55CB87|nr:uncharacterized protein LOC124643720 isoform X2 [Helicoverpa zea]